MGWFSNKNKPCPVCGSPTPRMFPTRVEGVPICRQCSAMIDLPSGALGSMALEDFTKYIAFYKENQALRSAFTPTYAYAFGLLSGEVVLDVPHRLFRLRDDENALVFEASHLKAFRVTEDGAPLLEGGMEALKCYQSAIPAVVNTLGIQLAQFQVQMRQYEQMAERRGRGGGPARCYERPDIDLLRPFQQFQVELLLEHPYWSGYTNARTAPGFDPNYPSIQNYLKEYDEKVRDLHQFAAQLMQVLNPQAPEIQGGAEMYAAPVPGAADGIRKF